MKLNAERSDIIIRCSTLDVRLSDVQSVIIYEIA